MPFGTHLAPDGAVQFRLWAPAAREVELLIDPQTRSLRRPMRRAEQGWFSLQTSEAQVDSGYLFCIDSHWQVPDPASRFNPRDVHGPSVVVDPLAFEWSDGSWRGRPWHEAIIYELHVGAFTDQGGFQGVERRLDYLARLGVTAIELMPLGDFPGTRNWGYDGVLWYAPDAAYGPPEDLKRLVVAAHRRGLMVLLDVVYNHFGPEGNFLHAYAPQFFTDRHRTPWGAAINYDGPGSRTVRDFSIHNALYWLEEFHLDGLRIDAVHAIRDDSDPGIISELAEAVRNGPGRERHVHLILENHRNEAHYLDESRGAQAKCDAQWNDDEHHCLHVLLTGESDGYYSDYAQQPHALLQRCLAEGFAFQGEWSKFGGAKRGEPSAHLKQTAFVPFLQNHDQIGNRARGERLHRIAHDESALLAATALVLLAPAPPLVFMGEEWHALEPFPFFCDFEPELAAKIRAGRRREFAQFSKASSHVEPPDACDPHTYLAARLDWSRRSVGNHKLWLRTYRRLLSLRRREIVPRLEAAGAGVARYRDGGAFGVDWALADRSTLHLQANLAPKPARSVAPVAGRVLFSTHPRMRTQMRSGPQPPWSVLWLLERARD